MQARLPSGPSRPHTLAPPRSRVLHYTSEEEQYFPCHASPADLAAHSRIFEQVFMTPASQELINHRYITVDLDIPQEILHMIVEAMYLRR